MADSQPPPPTTGRRGAVTRGVAASAVIVFAGQLLSRVMGLLRVTVIANVFGAPPEVSAFTAASTVPTIFYDLLLGGMVTAALVPVLTDYVTAGDREELGRLMSTLITLVGLAFVAIVLGLELVAPLLSTLVSGGLEPQVLDLATRLVHLILPALLFLSLWAVVVALLFARQEFVLPAIASSVFNLGTILMATFAGRRMGVQALSIGVVLGSFFQLLIVVPGLRGLRLRPRLDLGHPALRRIVALYLPVVGSLLVAQIAVIIDRNLASHTVGQALAWMDYATRLYQLPLGLVSVAIATATLPALARISSEAESLQFRRTLAGALRLVLVLIIPATVALLVLGQAAIRLILEHGEFTPADTVQVTWALLLYLPGLPFAAIDQPIVFAFYARKDTVTPVIVGILGVVAYLVVGPLLAFGLRMGFLGLVVANAVQLTTHCIILWLLLQRKVGSMAGFGMRTTAMKAAAASVVAGAAMFAGQALLGRLLPPTGKLNQLALLAGAGGVGLLTYVGGLALLRVDELATLLAMARARLGRTV